MLFLWFYRQYTWWQTKSRTQKKAPPQKELRTSSKRWTLTAMVSLQRKNSSKAVWVTKHCSSFWHATTLMTSTEDSIHIQNYAWYRQFIPIAQQAAISVVISTTSIDDNTGLAKFLNYCWPTERFPTVCHLLRQFYNDNSLLVLGRQTCWISCIYTLENNWNLSGSFRVLQE